MKNRFFRWLLRLRGSPEAIGRGIAIGVFVAFTPTVGFQMVIAIVLATLCKANRPAAIGPVWISNPFTIPPLFLFTYWVGSLFWPGPSVETVRKALQQTMQAMANYGFWQPSDQLRLFLNLGREILICMTFGGLVVGAVAGALSYFPTVWLVRSLRRRRQRRKQRSTQVKI